MMDGDKFAVYQLKRTPEYRQVRFRRYSELQEKGVKVRCEDYVQAYIGHMQPDETPETIRSRLGRQPPRNFKGHTISTSDVLVLNKGGVVISYYVDGEGFAVIPGFIHNISPGTEISIESAGCRVEGKKGSWHTVDSLIVDGQEFFLMEHDIYGQAGAYVVLDRKGKLAVDGVQRFDRETVQRIRDYMKPPGAAAEASGEEKTGSRHSGSPAPGSVQEPPTRAGNSGDSAAVTKKKKRASVLAKLRRKQAEIARRGREPAQ